MTTPDTTAPAVPDPRSGVMVSENLTINPALAKALERAGVDPQAVNVATTPEFWPTDLESLCILPCNYRGAVGQSPLMVILSTDEFPSDEKYAGYIGYFRAECATEDGEYVAWTHYMYQKESGEAGPLCQYVKDNALPLALRVVRVETSTKGRFVYRPMPLMASGASR